LKCSKCKRTWGEGDTDFNDIFEVQEFLHFSQRCGYGSIFGDGNLVSIQLCQHCTKKVLGPYLKIVKGSWHSDVEPKVIQGQ